MVEEKGWTSSFDIVKEARVERATVSSDVRVRGLQDEVTETGSESCEHGVCVQRRGSAGKLGWAGDSVGASRCDCGGVAGAVGRVGDRGVDSDDGGSLVGDAGGRRAGESDGVDTVDSGCDIDSGLVFGIRGWRRRGEGADKEGEEDGEHVLEGVHLEIGVADNADILKMVGSELCD
ncbi:hypothetical protein J1614_003605 [Plenodomus biglobosus]|nr:hypothetical protein J1614_003605 [Plenodomus biglobosus]